MKRRVLPVTVIVCFVISLGAVHLAGQSAPLRQTAYLKASNPGMSDHFGEGGALPGHTGMGLAISRDGNTIAVGAPHESSSARGINGNENDDSAYNAGAVYVYTPLRRPVDTPGVRQGLQYRRRRLLRQLRRAERRRQHDGRRRPLGVERRDRRERQPGRRFAAAGRRRLHLHAQRHHLDAAGVSEGLQYRAGGQQRRGPG